MKTGASPAEPSAVRPASRNQAKARASAPVARAATPSDSTKASSSPRTTSTRSESASSKPPSAGTNRSVSAGTSLVTTQRPSPLPCFSSPSLAPGPTVPRFATASGASHPPNVNSAPSPMAPSMPANSASRRRTSRLLPAVRNIEPPNRRSSGNSSATLRATAREGRRRLRADGRRRASFRKRNAPRAARDGQRPRGRAPHRFREGLPRSDPSTRSARRRQDARRDARCPQLRPRRVRRRARASASDRAARHCASASLVVRPGETAARTSPISSKDLGCAK